MGILNSTYLYEFYKNGFNSHQQNNVIKAKYPDRFFLYGSFDPREEEAGLEAFRHMVADTRSGAQALHRRMAAGLEGLAAERPWAYRYLALPGTGDQEYPCPQGADRLPVERDAFDVHDVDYAATDFPELNFIVEHVGLPSWTIFVGSRRRNGTSMPGCRWRWPLSIPGPDISARSWPICCSG